MPQAKEQIIRRYHVANVPIVAANPISGATAPGQFKISGSAFPLGDKVWLGMHIRISGTQNVVVGAGNAHTVVAMGVLKLIQSMFLRFSNIKDVIAGVDGLSMYRMLCTQLRRQLFELDPLAVAAGNANAADPFEVVLHIPFADKFSYHPEDTVIDGLVCGSPELIINWNPASTLGSISGAGNTLTINSLNVDVSVDVIENPSADYALPNWKPYWAVSVPPLTVGKRAEYDLPYNDRAYKRLHIRQVDTGTLAELADTIVGVNDQDSYSMTRNNLLVLDGIEHLATEHDQQKDYGTAVLPAGYVVLDWANPEGSGFRYRDTLQVIDANPGTLKLLADTTNPGAGAPALSFGMECIMELPAKRKSAVAPAA